MPAAAAEVAGLPALELIGAPAGSLDEPAAAASPLWEGLLGDGFSLSIGRADAGELIFSYGQSARFALAPDLRRMRCAHRDGGPGWQRALIGKVLPVVSLLLGYEALHASVLDSPEGAVAIMGPSGSGKSTLAAEAMRRGWPLFADDALILSGSTGAILAHPGTPHMNLDLDLPAGIDPDALGRTLAVIAGERWMAARASTAEPRPVAMLCLLERGPSRASAVRTLEPNPLALAPYMLGLLEDGARQRDRFSLYADLIEQTPLVALSADAALEPAALADLLEDALQHRCALPAGGVR
jgi:hypothetical protein